MYRATLVSGPFTKIASGVSVTSYKDSAVQKKTTYYYFTTATDIYGRESANSSTVQATVPNP